MRKTTIIIALALAAPAVFAQDKPAAPAAMQTTPAAAPATTTGDPVIISAGDLIVHKSEFEAAIKTLPPEYQTFALGTGKKQFADDFLRMKLLAAEGMRNNLQNDPEVVSQLNLMKENLVATAALKKIESGLTVTDADLKKAYESNQREYEQVKARHILIAFKGSAAAQPGKKELTDAEAKAKADEIRKKLVAGADFAELAKKESDDTGSGTRGGDLGSFGHAQMVEEFEKAAFAAKAGEITPVVKTQYGYHIIQVQEHNTTPMAQVRDTLEKNLRQKAVKDALEAMKEKSKATFDQAYFAPPPAPKAESMDAPGEKTKVIPAPASKPATKPAPKSGGKKQ
ncbi:MAG: peptidylprolyl isomerase [Thermoanaerobaculia bacterium]